MPLAAIMSNSAMRKGGRDLVLHHLHTDPLADHLLAFLELPDAADVHAAGAIELQGPAARRRFGRAEHHADLLADLVDEDHRRLGLGDHAGQLAHRLAHEPGLQADVRIADLAFELLLGHQGGHGVDDDHVHGVGLDEHFGDVHRFLAATGLADQQRFQFDAQLLGPTGIEGVFGIDKGGDAAASLGLGHDVQGERRLAAGLRAKDFHNAAVGNALAAQGQVQRRLPVGMPVIWQRGRRPSGMMAPSPNCFSIWATVIFRAGWAASIASTSGRPFSLSAKRPALVGAVFFAMELLVFGVAAAITISGSYCRKYCFRYGVVYTSIYRQSSELGLVFSAKRRELATAPRIFPETTPSNNDCRFMSHISSRQFFSCV